MPTVGDFPRANDIANVLIKINTARTTWGLATNSKSKLSGDLILATDVSDLKAWTAEANTTSGANVDLTDVPDIQTGSHLINGNLLDVLSAKADEINLYCACDCNYCTCNCQYCTCNCQYCTCNCQYCTCDCQYSCTCDCQYSCTCNCQYSCTCDCQYSCTCNCNYACTCNCNVCGCDSDLEDCG